MSQRPMPLSGVSWPMVGEGGPTGTWRTRRPVIDAARCLAGRHGDARCQLCWMYCPEVVVTQGAPPQIDYRYCKGCGCCAIECPAKAIEMLPEEMPMAPGDHHRGVRPDKAIKMLPEETP